MRKFAAALAASSLYCLLFATSATAGMVHEITGLTSSPRSGLFNQVILSADGSTVVGNAGSGSAFRWTREQGLEFFNTIPGGEVLKTVVDVSGDGKTVLGTDVNSRWVLWSEQGGTESVFGSGYRAWAMSDDGTTVVGSQRGGEVDYTAVRWRRGEGIAPVPVAPLSESDASGVSGDGTIVTGWTREVAGPSSGFKWQEGDESATLFDPLAEDQPIYSVGVVSHNGEHFLGYTEDKTYGFGEAVIFREGFSPLHLAANERQHGTRASAISDDGRLVAGQIDDLDRGKWSFLWDPENGIREANEVLANDYGLADELGDWRVGGILGMSADGRTILAVASEPIGPNTYATHLFVAAIPEPATIVLAFVGMVALCIRRYTRRSNPQTPGY